MDTLSPYLYLNLRKPFIKCLRDSHTQPNADKCCGIIFSMSRVAVLKMNCLDSHAVIAGYNYKHNSWRTITVFIYFIANNMEYN